MMTPTTLKILLVLTWEPTIPIICDARYVRFGNCYSRFAHQVKGLKGISNTIILLKIDNLTLRKSNVTFPRQAMDPVETNCSTTYPNKFNSDKNKC
jgi:hypothetical protein